MAAKRSKSKTALRGAVNNVIMESLIDGEKYGYEIIKEVEEKTNGKIKLKQPSLYSSLKRFEAKGYIESYWQDSDIGGKRHYYKLTPAGISYYKKHVAKEVEDDFEEIEDEVETMNYIDETSDSNDDYLEDQLSGYEIDEHEESSDLTKYEYNVEDKLNSLLNNNSSKEELLDELYNEIDEDTTIYSEDDIEREYSVQETIVADHEFRTPTPLTNTIELDEDEIADNALNDIMTDEDDNNDIFDDITLSTDSADEVEKEDVKIEKSKPHIITDENGITKMYYQDIHAKQQNTKVFDNVVYRTNTQDLYASLNNKKYQKEEVLTEEEKELRSKRFFEKFDSKSEQIMREKQLSKANEPTKQDTQENKIDYNYKSKLNNLFDSMIDDNDEENYTVDNNSYNDEEYSSNNFENEFTTEEEYVEEYNTTFETDESDDRSQDYTMKVYTEEKAKDPTVKYLQVNKAKFSFGLCMLVFMLCQVTVMLVLFKSKNLLMDNQFWVFQLSYAIVGIVTLIYCVPVFISPNRQASNNFKLAYSLMFGVLAFFIVVILTYAINTFMGMELFNIKYYLATLIVPTILSLNFIFGPLIYWLMTQNKRFY